MWPDAAVRENLYALAQRMHRECGGRLMRRDNLHLTLVFLGNVARESIPQLEAIAQRQSGAGFDLNFGVTGYWRHNRIVWAAPAAAPAALSDLVATLERALKTDGFKFDARTYVPHITLVRDARAPAVLPPLAFAWPVRDFALIESARGVKGAEYRVLVRWPCAA